MNKKPSRVLVVRVNDDGTTEEQYFDICISQESRQAMVKHIWYSIDTGVKVTVHPSHDP